MATCRLVFPIAHPSLYETFRGYRSLAIPSLPLCLFTTQLIPRIVVGVDGLDSALIHHVRVAPVGDDGLECSAGVIDVLNRLSGIARHACAHEQQNQKEIGYLARHLSPPGLFPASFG